MQQPHPASLGRKRGALGYPKAEPSLPAASWLAQGGWGAHEDPIHPAFLRML